LALNAGNCLSQIRVNCACMFPVCAVIAITVSSFFYVLM
jgi:hypothetical protein